MRRSQGSHSISKIKFPTSPDCVRHYSLTDLDTSWWQRHKLHNGVNNLPKIAAQQCPSGSQTMTSRSLVQCSTHSTTCHPLETWTILSVWDSNLWWTPNCTKCVRLDKWVHSDGLHTLLFNMSYYLKVLQFCCWLTKYSITHSLIQTRLPINGQWSCWNTRKCVYLHLYIPLFCSCAL